MTLLEIWNVLFLLSTSIGNLLDCIKSLPQRCCLFLMLWKNASRSLLGSIFCSKPLKCTHVSDCPLSFSEQFLALIPRYTSFTYFTDNGFKPLLGRVNFIIILYHSLYVTLIPLMTDIASNIQQASFRGVDWQALLTSIRCKKMMFWILSGSQIWKC